MLNKTGVFFDFDGTVADSLGIMYQCYKEFVTAIGGNPSESEFQSLNGPPLPIVIAQLCNTHKVPFNPNLLDNYNQTIDRNIENCKPVSGASAVLRKAREMNFICAIVTSNSKLRVQNWLSNNNLEHDIDFVIAGDSTSQGKPHPDPYLLALSKAKVVANYAVAIEDSHDGVRSATLAGINTLWLADQKVKEIENSIWIDRFVDAIPHLENLALKANCK